MRSSADPSRVSAGQNVDAKMRNMLSKCTINTIITTVIEMIEDYFARFIVICFDDKSCMNRILYFDIIPSHTYIRLI